VSGAFLVFAALDADANATVTAPFAYAVKRVSCAATVFTGPSFAAAQPTYGATSDTGLQGGNYAVVDAAHTALYAGGWGDAASTTFAEGAAAGAVAIVPVAAGASFALFQQTLAAGTASARRWPTGVFPTAASQAAAAASSTSTADGAAGWVAAPTTTMGGLAGAYSAATGFFTLFWVAAGTPGVFRDAQTSAAPAWAVAASGAPASFTAWATGSVAADATLVAVAFDAGAGALYAAGARTLHKCCAAPATAAPCVFTALASLDGTQQFRGLAMAPSGCGAVRRLSAAEDTGAAGGGSGGGDGDAAAAAA